MYEEGNKSLNWMSVAVKLIILAIIVFLACWIFIRISNNSVAKKTVAATSDTEYITNIASMKSAAFEYFTASKLPEKVGGTEKLTLNQMLNQKLLIDFTNDGKKCSLNDSYVQTTKTADGNYALKVSLTCDEKSDFIVTTIESNSCTITNTCPSADTKKSTVVDDADVIPADDPKYNTGSTSTNKATNTTTNSSTVKQSTNTTSNNTTKVVEQPVTQTVKSTVTVRITCSANCSKDEPVYPAVMYTVRFDVNGGKEYIANQAVTAGGYVTRPTNPTRDGYTFVGWELNGYTYDFNNKVLNDMTLKAVWRKNDTKKYNVYFDLNGGTGNIYTQVVEVGNKATKPVNPTRNGYTFVEWQINGYTYDFNNGVYGDITLVAKWRANNTKTRYYEYIRYTDWAEGYSNLWNAENKKFEVTKYSYCKNEQTKMYYSTGYVDDWTEKNKTYKYEYQMLDLDPTKVIGVKVNTNSKAYFNNSNLTDYYNYRALKDTGAIYMTGNTGKNDQYLGDIYAFRDSALKSQHFTFDVSAIKFVDNIYRVDISVNYKNNNGLTPYPGTHRYPVPLKFSVSYYNKSDCINTTSDNYNYYYNLGYTAWIYEGTEYIWKYRTYETKMSPETSLSGWTRTGHYEDRV